MTTLELLPPVEYDIVEKCKAAIFKKLATPATF
jgi:hypothetical protein